MHRAIAVTRKIRMAPSREEAKESLNSPGELWWRAKMKRSNKRLTLPPMSRICEPESLAICWRWFRRIVLWSRRQRLMFELRLPFTGECQRVSEGSGSCRENALMRRVRNRKAFFCRIWQVLVTVRIRSVKRSPLED